MLSLLSLWREGEGLSAPAPHADAGLLRVIRGEVGAAGSVEHGLQADEALTSR